MPSERLIRILFGLVLALTLGVAGAGSQALTSCRGAGQGDGAEAALAMGECLLAAGDTAAASAWIASHATALAAPPWQGAGDEIRGRIALAQGREAEARAHFHAAERCDAPSLAARAALNRAEELLLQGLLAEIERTAIEQRTYR